MNVIFYLSYNIKNFVVKKFMTLLICMQRVFFITTYMLLNTVSHFSYAPIFKAPHFFHKNAGIEYSL